METQLTILFDLAVKAGRQVDCSTPLNRPFGISAMPKAFIPHISVMRRTRVLWSVHR
jgi:hypothetical protein